MSNYSPDQPIVKGADVIYPPTGLAGEYAPLATNPYVGCGHGCKYCYVPLVSKQPRAEFNAGAVERKGYRERLLNDLNRYERAGELNHQVMLSFMTDPYHPGDSSLTTWTLRALAGRGLGFCTLTKGGARALRDLPLFRPDRDAFASTLTSLDDAFSLKWEPDAALPGDRIATLRRFHEAGIFTWVSLEPTLDAAASLAIVEATCGFVDLFKIGKANYLKGYGADTDWRDYTLRMVDACQTFGVLHYIKKDLQEFLPAGYPNPLRVEQHR